MVHNQRSHLTIKVKPFTGSVFRGSEFRVQDGYDHAGRTRATIRGFTKYLIAYEQGQQKTCLRATHRQEGNPER